MQHKKIGWLLLSGLTIGPILGSGIIILPPVVYAVAGEWALPAWILMVCAGSLFAALTGVLSARFPGDQGISRAVETAFGPGAGRLTACYLIGAVCFGPGAVILTAARYAAPVTGLPMPALGFILLVICAALLLGQVRSMGKAALAASSLSAITLCTGSAATLLSHSKGAVMLPPLDLSTMGQTLLLLFWIIVGWEVIGNYSQDVDKPEATIKKAVIFSALVIAMVDIIVAAAVQWVDAPALHSGQVSIVTLLVPLFGDNAALVTAILTLALCTTTYLLFVGGVARLMASLSRDGFLPAFLARRTPGGSPAAGTLLLACIHVGILGMHMLGLMDIEDLIALANGFFIANALLGILAGIKLINSTMIRTGAVILALVFTGILMCSSPAVIVVIAGMGGIMAVKQRIARGCQA
ncbi:MAG: hypothetical protein V1793_18400 [Pseudomonadota bacterium]